MSLDPWQIGICFVIIGIGVLSIIWLLLEPWIGWEPCGKCKTMIHWGYSRTVQCPKCGTEWSNNDGVDC